MGAGSVHGTQRRRQIRQPFEASGTCNEPSRKLIDRLVELAHSSPMGLRQRLKTDIQRLQGEAGLLPAGIGLRDLARLGRVAQRDPLPFELLTGLDQPGHVARRGRALPEGVYGLGPGVDGPHQGRPL